LLSEEFIKGLFGITDKVFKSTVSTNSVLSSTGIEPGTDTTVIRALDHSNIRPKPSGRLSGARALITVISVPGLIPVEDRIEFVETVDLNTLSVIPKNSIINSLDNYQFLTRFCCSQVHDRFDANS